MGQSPREFWEVAEHLVHPPVVSAIMPLSLHTRWVLETPPELSRAPQDSSLTPTAQGHPAPRAPLLPQANRAGGAAGPVSPQTWGLSPRREVACQDSMCVWRLAGPPRGELSPASPWGVLRSPVPVAGSRKDSAPTALQVPKLQGCEQAPATGLRPSSRPLLRTGSPKSCRLGAGRQDRLRPPPTLVFTPQPLAQDIGSPAWVRSGTRPGHSAAWAPAGTVAFSSLSLFLGGKGWVS